MADVFDPDAYLSDEFNPDSYLETPDKKKVMSDFNKFDEDAKALNPDSRDTLYEGKVASYLSAQGGGDVRPNEVGSVGRNYIADKQAVPSQIHSRILGDVVAINDLNDTTAAIQSIFDDYTKDTGIELVAVDDTEQPQEAKDIESQMKEVMATPEETVRETLEEAPLGRYSYSLAKSFLPQWLETELDDVKLSEADSAMDYVQDIGGSIHGTVASFVIANKLIAGGGGVRAIPKVGNMLDKITVAGDKGARVSKMIERSLNGFAAMASTGQIKSNSKDMKERLKMLGGDAMFAVAFPLADELALFRGLGVAAKPVAATSIGAIGFMSDSDAPIEQKVINGTSIAMMWIASSGGLSEAKTIGKDFAKANGISHPEQFVDDIINSVGKKEFIRKARQFGDKMSKESAVRRMAQDAAQKAADGLSLTLGEKMAVAKVNATEKVALARAGIDAPIAGDRASVQAEKVFELAKQEAEINIEQERMQDAAEEPPAPSIEQVEAKIINDADVFDSSMDDTLMAIQNISSNPYQNLLSDAEQLPTVWNPPEDFLATNTETPQGDKVMKQALHHMTRSAENVAGFFRRFGRQYISDKELGQKFDDSYHEIAAAPHEGILEIHDEMKKFPRIAKKVKADISIALEANDPSLVTAEHRGVYNRAKELLEKAEQMQIDAGVLSQSFDDTHAERIDGLDRKIAKATGNKRTELIAEKRRLEEIKQYLPHGVVAKRVMDNKLHESPVGAKRSFGKKLSQYHKTRKGTHSLKQYLEQGIISEGDLDVTKLLMTAYADAYHKIAVKSLIDWGKETGNIVPEHMEVEGDNWVGEADIHPIARIGGIDGMKMSRLFAQGLEELSGANKSTSNWFDKMLGAVKVGQFVNPSVIWRHNISQSIMGGSVNLNPKSLAKHSWSAGIAVATKNDMWREFDKYGLYQKTDLPTKQNVEQMIQQYSDKSTLYMENEGLSNVVNIMSSALGITPDEAKTMAKDKEFLKLFESAFMTIPRIVGGATFTGDEVQRTVSALTLMDKGYTAEEAAKEAAEIHGAYSSVGVPYKNIMKRVAFVYSFRFLMPWKYQLKPWIDLADYAYSKATGKKANSRKAKAAGWVVAVTTALPFLYDAYMKSEGWEMDKKERESGFRKFADKMSLDIPIGNEKTALLSPNWAPTWRYSKTIETPDGPKNLTRVVGTPNVTFTRFGVRATKQMPENIKNEIGQGIIDATWAEIHPFYKISAAFLENDPLTYGDMPPRGIDGNNWIGGIGKAYLASFRVYGALLEMEKAKLIDKGESDRLLDEHISTFDKALSWGAFDYISNTDDRKAVGKFFQLKDNLRELQWQIDRAETLTEAEKKQALETLKEKTKDSLNRIKESRNK